MQPVNFDYFSLSLAVSGVIHFVNPFVPTMHFNYRYFEVQDVNDKKCSWFGGGQDLTPIYIDEEVNSTVYNYFLVLPPVLLCKKQTFCFQPGCFLIFS